MVGLWAEVGDSVRIALLDIIVLFYLFSRTVFQFQLSIQRNIALNEFLFQGHVRQAIYATGQLLMKIQYTTQMAPTT